MEKRQKLGVQFLGFFERGGRQWALYQITKGSKSALETFKDSQGVYYSIGRQGYPLYTAFEYFGDHGVISSYVSKKDGSVKWGPDLNDLKKLRSLSEILGTDFVSQMLGKEFNLPDIEPETPAEDKSSEG